MRFFRRKHNPEASPAAVSLLDVYGATQHQLPRGYWVYVLHEADGTEFRIGQVTGESAGNLISRLRDHIYTYKGRFHHYSLVACRDAHQTDVRELALIDWYEANGLVNLAGTADVEALRRRIRQSKGGSGLRPRNQDYGEATG